MSAATDLQALLLATSAVTALCSTRISADRPVQVIAGHKCSKVPQDVEQCDNGDDNGATNACSSQCTLNVCLGDDPAPECEGGTGG